MILILTTLLQHNFNETWIILAAQASCVCTCPKLRAPGYQKVRMYVCIYIYGADVYVYMYIYTVCVYVYLDPSETLVYS